MQKLGPYGTVKINLRLKQYIRYLASVIPANRR